jgi:hypothetical protein
MNAAALPLAAILNDACQCVWVDRSNLAARLADQLGPAGPQLPEGMISGSVVFVDQRQVTAMDRTIALIRRVVGSSAFEDRVAVSAPGIARRPQPTSGGVLGFDFHLGRAEPQLIEINTNPGGMLVSVELARAATAFCDCFDQPLTAMASGSVPLAEVDACTASLLLAEFHRVHPDRELRTIAIVDDQPQAQYLLPEFVLYQKLLAKAGYRALIADAAQLELHGDALVAQGFAVDLVYNRCTDFYFVEERHAALREAYERDLAVITPHPAAHARWADKRLLAWLREEALLRRAGLDTDEIAHLQKTIPATEVVEATRAEDLWSRRKKLFFKPVDGFGGKAAYRGDKLTRKAFEHILSSRYVAQAIAPTSSRRVQGVTGDGSELRVDVRNFAADGQTWLRATRLYRGQTTNFRTAGGGFAPALTVPACTEHDAPA